jgi:hypothetical protein
MTSGSQPEAAEAFELADCIQTNRKTLYTMLREAGKTTLRIALAGLLTGELQAWLDAAKAQGLCTGYRVLNPLPASADEPDDARGSPQVE